MFFPRQSGKSILMQQALNAGKTVMVVNAEGATLRKKRGRFVVITPVGRKRK